MEIEKAAVDRPLKNDYCERSVPIEVLGVWWTGQ